jgi:predicted DNA-binding antitoxin AbrB/MazE fold protein
MLEDFFMGQVIMATFENGLLKPDDRLDWPTGARVRLIVEAVDISPEEKEQAWQELEELWDEAEADSGDMRFTRDQLHERR